MTPSEFYSLSFNPFEKGAVKEKDVFRSRDHQQAVARLGYVANVHGICVITASPGLGKTLAVRCFVKEGLSPSLSVPVYISLSTISVREFYQALASQLGLELAGSKPSLFNAIQERIFYLYKEKRQPLFLVLDECQYLSQGVLNDLKMLMNYGYDSLNCFSLVLCGESWFNKTISKNVNEALRQRVVVHYDYRGLGDDEVEPYIRHKITLAGGAPSIISGAAISAIHGYAEGNPREIDQVMNDAMKIGAQNGKTEIDPETVLAAVNEQAF